MSARRLFVASLGLAAAALLASTSAQAQDDQPWSLGVTAGISYDDNVTVEQLDVKSGVSDTIGNFGLSAGYEVLDSKTNQLKLSYDFSQSLHDKLTNFDLQSHAVGFTGSTDLGGVSLGYSYKFFHMLLGGKSFLNMHVVNPSLSGFVTPNLYVRGSYFYFDKSFHTFVGRNASYHQPDLAIYYFFNQSKSYVSVGGHYEIENTAAPQYDYKGYAFTTALQVPVDLSVRTVKFQLGYTYLHRDYDNITPSIAAKRFETRSTVKLSAEIPLVDRLAFTLDYKYVDRDSNLLATKYSENVVGGTLGYDF